MTMPHLMNCPHSDTGWCLDCVKKLWERMNRYEITLEKISNPLADLLQNMEPGTRIDGHYATQLNDDANYLKEIALKALEAESD